MYKRTKHAASALRDPLDEMLSQDTRESITAIARCVSNNIAASGYKLSAEQLLHAAAWHSGHCTSANAEPLDWAHALMRTRHYYSSRINQMESDAMQQAYVAVTALEEEIGSHEYKQTILEQSKIVHAHLALPLEAMAASAFGFILYGNWQWPDMTHVRVGYAAILQEKVWLAEQEAKRQAMLKQLMQKAGG